MRCSCVMRKSIRGLSMRSYVKASHVSAVLLTMSMAYPGLANDAVITCNLARTGQQFEGQCVIPCSVQSLATDITGPKGGVTCEQSFRKVDATLSPAGKPGRWLGTMEGRFPEDPKRVDLIEGGEKDSGGAKTP